VLSGVVFSNITLFGLSSRGRSAEQFVSTRISTRYVEKEKKSGKRKNNTARNR
jgi:hypothetical protein